MIMLRNDSRALRDGFSMIMLRLYKHVPCMPSSSPSTNQRHQHRRRFIVIVCSRAGSMSWYIVFQVDINESFLEFPSALSPEPFISFGRPPVTHPQMQIVRGGRRAWALARRWAVDGRWGRCMRVHQIHNTDIRAIRIDDPARVGALGPTDIRAERIAQRTVARVNSNWYALFPSLQL